MANSEKTDEEKVLYYLFGLWRVNGREFFFGITCFYLSLSFVNFLGGENRLCLSLYSKQHREVCFHYVYVPITNQN